MVRVVPMDDQLRNVSELWDYEMVALAQGDLRMERLGQLAPRGLRIIEAAPESQYARALRTELLRFLDMTPGETSRDPQLLEIRNRLKTGGAIEHREELSPAARPARSRPAPAARA